MPRILTLIAMILALTTSMALADFLGPSYRANSGRVSIAVSDVPTGTGQDYIVEMHLEAKGDAKLNCLNLLKDFHFSLKDVSGKPVPIDPDLTITKYSYIGRDAHGMMHGDTSRCDPRAETSGGFIFRLGGLYPHLLAGKYTLDILFAPQSAGFAPIHLPTIPITIVS